MMGLKIDGLLDLRILVIVFELFHDNILNSWGTTTHVENNVCSNVIYRTVSAISVSIPPVRHALVTTVELKYLNCRHSNVRIGGIRDNNVTFYMGTINIRNA